MALTGIDRSFTPPLESGFEDSPRGVDTHDDTPFTVDPEDREWMRYARDAYQSSETWFDSSMRKVFERSLANFRSVHPPGSKYYTEQYLKKSRIFRPKTRGAIRRGEAGHAIAFFSTHDVVHCSAVNETDPKQQLAAEVHNALLNYRLNQADMHWFQTLIGGCQDAMTSGVVISKQSWEYEQRQQEYEYRYEEQQVDGSTIESTERGFEEEVKKDRPTCRLIPVENFRFDPAAAWYDPVNTSPYTIELIPMYVWEIRERMKKIDPSTGRPEYRPLQHNLLAAAIQQDWDSVRKAREGQRIDKYDNDTAINDYQSVWVHHNIVNRGGRDYVFDSLGVEILLSEPKPIEQVYLHSSTGDRPYAMGMAVIEAHKQYPAGIPQLLEDLQEEANDIANLRLDNVKLALNKRWFARRGVGVDVRSLVRNIPASVTFMSDTERDVKEVATKDVTGASYQEQDRLNLDIDDLIGTFSQGSVASNRRLNETVGGMNLLSGDANMLQEYMIRTISETWVEPVLRQLVQLEANYETDEEVLRVVAATALQPEEGQDPNEAIATVLDSIAEPINVNVNVGFNATNPQKRIEKLSLGLTTVASFMPQMMEELDSAEVIKEVFGAIGYKDGTRFFPSLGVKGQDPMIEQLTQQVQELQQIVESDQAKEQAKAETTLQVTQMREEGAMAREQMKQETELMKLQAKGDIETFLADMKNRLEEIDRMLKAEESQIHRQELYLQREALSHTIQQADREYMLKLRDQDQAEVEQATKGAHNLKGEDKAGVISRQNYDLIPSNIM